MAEVPMTRKTAHLMRDRRRRESGKGEVGREEGKNGGGESKTKRERERDRMRKSGAKASASLGRASPSDVVFSSASYFLRFLALLCGVPG